MSEQKTKRQAFDDLNAHIVETIEAGGTFPRPRHIRLAMKACQDKQWDVEWLEMLVLFNCYGRAKAAKTHGALGKIKRRRIADDEHEKFDAFMAKITDILHPSFLTPHGYNVTFDHLDSTAIFASLGQIAAPLADLGCPLFLYAGALLGYERSRALIGHDDDIDLGVYLGDCTTSQVPARWAAYKKKLKDAELLSNAEIEQNKAMFKITTALPIEVDLFPAWTDQGRFSVYPYSFGELSSDVLLPLKSFGQDPLMLPADTQALLAQSYGTDWRIPDPLFHLNWWKKKQIFSELIGYDYAL